ncbi:MAG: phytanoyl-CoA dioxygenase family protein [Dongiaceae bacterium]
MSLATAPEPYRVGPETIAAYDRDGAVLLRGLADAGWIERVRAGIERSLVDRATGEASAYFKRLRMWESDADLRAFCLHSAVPSVAAQLLQTDRVNLLYDQVFVKEPGSFAPTPWHNDQPYWPVRGTQLLTLWVACDPVTLANGGLEFVRGSHRQSRWYRPFDTDETGRVTEIFKGDEDRDFEDMPDIEAARDRLDIVSWEMQPGDALAFHALTLHAARGNGEARQRRRAYAIRLTGRDVRYYAGRVWNSYITNPALQTGDRLDGPQYPVVYPA